MKFGPVPVGDAEGAILAHSLAVGGTRLRKGVELSADHIALFRKNAIETVTVARLEEGDVGEDLAAATLARALVPDPEAVGLRISNASTGRVNVHATAPGILEVDAEKINRANAIHPMITVATPPQLCRLGARGLAATVKIISYAVPEAALKSASTVAQNALRLRQPVHMEAAFLQTTLSASDAPAHQATEARLSALGVKMRVLSTVSHEMEALAQSIAACEAPVLFVLTASATSDIEDTAPAALVRAGGEITAFGMPVDPGNLLFLGQRGGMTVIGLPGCARSPALNGADWIMERVLCGVPVTQSDISQMGVGGLLKEIPTRPQPREK